MFRRILFAGRVAKMGVENRGGRYYGHASDGNHGELVTDPRDPYCNLFLWYLNAGEVAGLHYHPASEEILVIGSGRVRLDSGKEMAPGDWCRFAAGEPHEVTAIEDSLFIVHFSPPVQIEVNE